LGPVAFEAHIPAGLLDEPALPDGALKVAIPVNGAEANYLQGLTHLTQLHGTGTLTGNAFSADIAGARIGPLAVTQGRVVISDLSVPASPGDFTAHVAGTMPDILNLIDMKPLNYPTRFGIDKSQTKGQANLDLSFHLPLRKNLSVDEVGIAIKAAVTDFSILLGDHAHLTDGTVNFQIDNAKLHAGGNALLADSRLAFDWSEDFRTSNVVTTRIGVKGTLDSAGREALNFPSAAVLKGPTTITAALTGHRGSLLSADMTMDLAPAALNLDLIGLNKPSGFPANAHVTASFGPQSSIKAETLMLSGPGVAVNGNAAFDKDGHLISLSFPNIHFGAANDFSFNLMKGPSGATVTVRGRSLDGSRLGGHGAGDDMKLEGPFRVVARVDRLMLRDNISLAPFSLDVSGVGDRPTSLAMSGALSKSASVTAEISAAEGGRRLTLATNDAGAFVKGLFGFGSLKGGKIDLSATLPSKIGEPENSTTPDYQGKLTVRDFKVLNQPFLTRLFTAGSLGGMINLMQGQGIAVDKLEVPFSSRNGVVSVHDSKATGPSIGLTADGYIDRPKNTIALKGTLVPLFGLNSVLGAIPVLGNVLVSKPGEGVFGMTYSIKGNADQPDLNINPLSVLTPGIFRRIFEGRMPTAAQAPSNQAPPPAPVPQPNPPQ
ncbi:MAG TPA: AsmA-like C-terminal domain-containing protein, partial [Rhizomicrobium sp.]|nr:AsmA-like C-terminal domain-containing protein [Rhizomicrobium sp.]